MNVTSPLMSVADAATSTSMLETCAVYDFVVETVLMGLLCLLGFVGNILSVLCLRRNKSKTATPFLLMSLEVADTSFLSTVVVLRVCDSALTTFAGWRHSANLVPVTRFLFPVAQTAMTCTVYLTLLVTLNRYMSVCRPHQVLPALESRHSKIHVALVAVFAIVFNIPRFFEYEMAEITSPFINTVEASNETLLVLTKSEFGRSRTYRLVYANALYCLFMFLIPLSALLLLNAQLIREVSRARRRRRFLLGERLPPGRLPASHRRISNVRRHKMLKSSSSSASQQSRATERAHRTGSISGGEDDITLTLVVVVVVFVVCQTPALVTQVLVSTHSGGDNQDDQEGDDGLSCPSPLFFYVRLSDLLVVINSAINFAIYCFCSRRFRQSFKCLVLASRGGSSGGRAVTAGGGTKGGVGGAGIVVHIDSASDRVPFNSVVNACVDRHQLRTRSLYSSLSPETARSTQQPLTRSLTDDAASSSDAYLHSNNFYSGIV